MNPLTDLVRTSVVRTIDDVIRVMRAIDAMLPDDDGLKWFNLLYLRVTESVKNAPPAGGWHDPQWLERLDVVFAQLYFDAAREPERAKAWRPLFRARRRADVARIQFAFAGMNAHINHDLALAVVRTGEERNIVPRRGMPQHRDFERVNALLEAVEAEVKAFLLTGVLRHVDGTLGRLDDVLAIWKVSKARDTAWSNAEVLWQLRQLPFAAENFMRSVAGLVSLSSGGLLVPTR
jgi:Family of unknown function (DUF5995)